MGHIIDTNPWAEDINPELTPVQTGCCQCGTICPWTDETDPPLTSELSTLWFEAHKQICNAPKLTWEQTGCGK